MVVVGNLEQLAVNGNPNPEKTSAFELYRNSIHDVEIITFDELYERARFSLKTSSSLARTRLRTNSDGLTDLPGASDGAAICGWELRRP